MRNQDLHIQGNIFIIFLLIWLVTILSCDADRKDVGTESNLEYLLKINKIDIHKHVKSEQSFLKNILDKMNIKYCKICTTG